MTVCVFILQLCVRIYLLAVGGFSRRLMAILLPSSTAALPIVKVLKRALAPEGWSVGSRRRLPWSDYARSG
jgi:hypothetical protein